MQRAREGIRVSLLRWVEEPGASLLKRLGFSPNVVTILGFLVVIGSAVLAGFGYLRLAGVVFLAGGAFDLFDGALARLSNRVTPFGALLDSLLDRLGEAALYISLAIYGVHTGRYSPDLLIYMILLIVALSSSQTVSYLRARGESLGVDTNLGILTRPERVVILGVGLILGGDTVPVAFGIISVLSLCTILSRLLHVWRSLRTG